MCGISGFISKKYEKSDLIKMTNSLTHRGPDAEGFYFNDEKVIMKLFSNDLILKKKNIVSNLPDGADCLEEGGTWSEERRVCYHAYDEDSDREE